MSIEDQDGEKSLRIESPEIKAFAEALLGVSALAGFHNVSQIILKADSRNYLKLPISTLESYGMDRTDDEDDSGILDEDAIATGQAHSEAVTVSAMLIELCIEQLGELDEDCSDCKADPHYRRALLLLRQTASDLHMRGEELVHCFTGLKPAEHSRRLTLEI
ncbi:MAG: hypothetical protein DCF22_00475 [Leptolyngbya sp.]|nr:MAG: hypothetical protein DCF22_00475 [Leptolyngbya sp.]